MGKYASCICKRNCTLCQTSSGLLFLLGRFICLKPSSVKKASPAADLLEGWGTRQLCPALPPSHKSGKSSSSRVPPDAGTLHSWQLPVLALRMREGYGWTDSAGHWHCWGLELELAVSIWPLSLRGWTCLFPAECWDGKVAFSCACWWQWEGCLCS